MNSRTIEIIVEPSGEIQIDAVGFKGPDCEQATRFLEEALGVVGQKTKKPEYHQSARKVARQKLGGYPTPLFVDVEFNRRGANDKLVGLAGEDEEIRPDIIVHDRRLGPGSLHVLVVECKLLRVSQSGLTKDRDKLHALMRDRRYQYAYGLQVVYGGKALFSISDRVFRSRNLSGKALQCHKLKRIFSL